MLKNVREKSLARRKVTWSPIKEQSSENVREKRKELS